MRVALIHYWLVGMRGGERVLERLLHLYPQADIFTHVVDPARLSPALRAAPIHTSFVAKLPFARRLYPHYLPLMPLALEAIDLSGYDLVISSEAGPSKGVIPPPEATHVCYCHTPMRYLWDQRDAYRASAGSLTRAAMPLVTHGLRQWDVTSAARVDRFAANSRFVARRIQAYWRRESIVVHPPVDGRPFEQAALGLSVEQSFLWIGQLVPYKRCDLAVAAFSRLKLPLLVVGRGPELRRLQALAGDTVRFVDRLPDDDLARAFARARALVFTAREDFGITPVETMAAGRPVLAFAGGGALETVQDGVTGLFFAEQTVASVMDGVERLIGWLPHFDPRAAQARARDFAPDIFDQGFRRVVDAALAGRP